MFRQNSLQLLSNKAAVSSCKSSKVLKQKMLREFQVSMQKKVKLEEYSQPCSDQERSARLCNKSQSARCRKTESAFSASCNWLNNEVRGGNKRNMWCLSCAHVVPMLCLCCASVQLLLCNFAFRLVE